MNKNISLLLSLIILFLSPLGVSHCVSAAGDSYDDPIIITDASGLTAIATGLNKHYKIVNDIGPASVSIGGPFTGTLRGDKGGGEKPKITLNSSAQGLFSIIGTGTVENIIINANVSSSREIGIVSGFLRGGTIRNVEVEGGVNGTQNNSQRIGGIVGMAWGTVENCVNRANITSVTEGVAHTGGVVGICLEGQLTISNCENYGNVTATSMAVTLANGNIGGIIGSIWSKNTGNGWDTDDSVVENCLNKGNVSTSGQNTGGIVGTIYNNTAVIASCANNGNVSSTNNNGRVGGIVGGDYGTVKKSFNTGDIAGVKDAGGIFGYVSGSSVNMENNYNIGNVHATSNAGGITYSGGSSVIKNNYNVGEVSVDSGSNFSAALATGTGTVSGNYYLDTLNPGTVISDNAKVKALSDTEMQSLTNFSGFDSGIWTTDPSNRGEYPYHYPTLTGNPHRERVVYLKAPQGFSVSADSPYILTFTGDDSALGYEIKITYWSAETTLYSNGALPSVDITSAIKTNGQYYITAKSLGYGDILLDSAESAYTYTHSGGIDNEILITRAEIKFTNFLIIGRVTGAEAYNLTVVVGKPGVPVANIQSGDILCTSSIQADNEGEFDFTFSVGEYTGVFEYIVKSDVPPLEATGSIIYTPSADNSLASFSLDGYSGTINGGAIAVTIPSTVLKTGLVAAFSAHSEASVSVNGVAQINGVTKNNFSSPVTYEVMAENGSKKSYTVTVTNAPESTGGGGGGGGGGSVVGAGKELLISGVALPSATPLTSQEAPAVTSVGFSDIPKNHWAQSYVDALVEKNVLSGYDDGTFRPDNFVTREEFVKMVVSAFGFDGGGEIAFADVSPKDWYYDYIRAAVHNGIIMGISDTEFGVGLNITREDMAVIILRAAQATNISLNETANKIFADSEDISDYAVESVMRLANSGIINGYENGVFLPKSNGTRAEVAYIIHRIAERTLI